VLIFSEDLTTFDYLDRLFADAAPIQSSAGVDRILRALFCWTWRPAG
jgi:hypothetical protein